MADAATNQTSDANKAAEFDLNGYMQANGLRLKGLDETGQPEVTDQAGRRATLDVNALLRSTGADPDKTHVLYNTPNNPLQISALSTVERAELGLNPGLEGQKRMIPYLMQHFDRVAQNDQGVVVQKDGIWHQIDPHMLGEGDAHQKTKEFIDSAVQGAAGLVPQIAATAPTSTLAATIGGAAGAVGLGALGVAAGPALAAGALAGLAANAYAGGRVMGHVKASFGRMLGTYDATPDEQAEDEKNEALLNMGGEVIGMGLRNTVGNVVKAAKRIGAWGTNATKDLMADAFGRSTGAGVTTTRAMFDMAPEVGQKMTDALAAAGGNRSGAVQAAKTSAIAATNDLMDMASKKVTSVYGDLMQGLLSKAGDAGENFTANFNTIGKKVFDSLEENGIGKVIKTMTYHAAPEEAADAIETAGMKPLSAIESAIDVPPSPKMPGTVSHNLSIKFPDVTADNAPGLEPGAPEQVKKVVQLIGEFQKLGEQTGQEAAQKLVNLNRRLNDMTNWSFDGNVTQSFKRAMSVTQDAVKGAIGDEFDKAGLSDEYNKLAGLYKTYGDGVAKARQVLNSPNGANALQKQLTDSYSFVKNLTKPGWSRGSMDMADRAKFLMNNPIAAIVDLTGADGRDAYDSVMQHNAAAAFIPRMKLGLYQAMGTGAAVAGASHFVGPAAVPLGAAALTQFSPSMVAAEARAATGIARPVANVVNSLDTSLSQMGRDFLTKLTRPQLRDMLGNEDMVRQFFNTMTQATQEHQRIVGRAGAMMQGAQAMMPGDVTTDPELMKRIGAAMINAPIPENMPLNSPNRPAILGGRAYSKRGDK